MKFKGLKYYADLHKLHELEEMHQLQQDVMTQAFNAKEAVLKQVVEQVLGPNWTEDQVKEGFAFVHHIKEPDREFIAYKGQQIGELVFRSDIDPETFATTFTYTFVPTPYRSHT